MKKKEILKGLSLVLTVAIAMFVFLLGCCNQPLSVILATALPAAYIMCVTYIKLVKYSKNYGYISGLWIAIVYLIVIGLLMFFSQRAPGIFLLIFLAIAIILALFAAWNEDRYYYDYCDNGVSILGVLVSVAIFFVMLLALLRADLPYKNVANRYEDSKDMLIDHKVVSAEEMANVKNIYDLEELYLAQKQKADVVNDKLNDVKNTIKVRDYDSVEIPETKQLYIKRLWYNSDQTPWSYDAYGKLELNIRGATSLFFSRQDINANLNYNGEYVSEHNIEYVNIVLSDNTFYRFKVADNYQWLVAKEGDKVTKTFTKDELGFENLHKSFIKAELKLNL